MKRHLIKEETRKMNMLLDLYWTFVKIGCVTFGGGYAMLPILERELVDKRHWTTMDDLRDYFSIGQCTPGIIALNVSTFIGEKRRGIPGALAALLGITIPPILIMLLVVYIYDLVKDNLYVSRAMIGVRAAVVPIIISALLKLLKSGLKDAFCYLIAAAALALCLFTKMNNALIVLLGALVGLCLKEVQSRHDLS